MGSTIRLSRANELAEQAELDHLADLDAQENWDDADWRKQFHADLAEVIWLGFQHENLLELMTTVETAGEFERITVEVVEGIEVFWVAQGSSIDATSLDSKIWELPPAFVGYHVTENEDHIRSGFSKYQRKLVPQAVNQMDAAINSRLLRTLQARIGVSSPYYHAGAGIDLTRIDDAITEVEDEASGWPEIDAQKTAIIGRPPMITGLMSAIKDDNTFAPENNDELVRLGVIGQYHGATIIKLRNWRDRNRRSYFPGDELMITSTAASKVGLWAGLKSREWTEEGGEYWHNWGRRKVGFAVHHPEFARRIVDTDRAA